MDNKTIIIIAVLIILGVFLNQKYNFLGAVFQTGVAGEAPAQLLPLNDDGSTTQFREDQDLRVAYGELNGWILVFLDDALYKTEHRWNRPDLLPVGFGMLPWQSAKLCDEVNQFYWEFPQSGLDSIQKTSYVNLPAGQHNYEIDVMETSGWLRYCAGISCSGGSGYIERANGPFCDSNWIVPDPTDPPGGGKGKCWGFSTKLAQKIGSITVQPNPCIFNAGESLVLETFDGGNTIDPNNLKYSFSPSHKFCGIHPPIILDQLTKTSYTADFIMTQLENNQIYSVPQGKSIALFYITADVVPLSCDPTTQAYDPINGQCLDTIGFVFACTNGIFDPTTGVCTMQGSTVCPNGFRYDTFQDLCIRNIDCTLPDECRRECPSPYQLVGDLCISYGNISCIQPAYLKDGNCVIEPSTAYICIQGNLTEANECVLNIEDYTICRTGFVLNEETNECEKEGDIFYRCPEGYNWDSSITKCIKEGDIKMPLLERLTDIGSKYLLYILATIGTIAYFVWGRKK